MFIHFYNILDRKLLDFEKREKYSKYTNLPHSCHLSMSSNSTFTQIQKDTVRDIVREELVPIKEQMRQLVTKEEFNKTLDKKLRPLATKKELDNAIEQLVTKEEFHRAVEQMVTKDEFYAAMKKTLTKDEFYTAMDRYMAGQQATLDEIAMLRMASGRHDDSIEQLQNTSKTHTKRDS